ncbi:MAG: ribosome assembly RNA-binding protein YhbY [Firmicutes bacterium]|nr:ribosome assembly RNA-binding protein YhbY [Bacillota bacterium]
MLSSKERAYLRSLANTTEPVLQVGKSGITPTVIKQADDALTARELIKVRVLPKSGHGRDEIADRLSRAVSAEVVQRIGNNFVLWRRNLKEPKIQFP